MSIDANGPQPNSISPGQPQRPIPPQIPSSEDALSLLLTDNPMLDEGRRSWRRFFRSGKTGAWVGLGIFVIFYIWMLIESAIGDSDNSIFYCYIELILLTLYLPGSIHNSISGERELATWDALILTRLTAGQIIVGKLLWRFRMMLVIAALAIVPMVISRLDSVQSSTTAMELFATQMMLLSWGILLCCFGLWVSSVTKRSITSLMVIAATVIGLLLVFPGLYTMFQALIFSNVNFYTRSDLINRLIDAFNPYISLSNLLHLDGTPNSNIALPGSSSGILQIAVYLGASLIFSTLTFFRLKRLEGPSGGTR